MEELIEELIQKGKIEISDNISFRKKSECASLFGRNFTNILRGGVPHPSDKKINGIIFWQEGENERWENTYSENDKGEITKFTELKKISYKEWIDEWSREELKKDRRIIFYKKKGEEYKFRGIFELDFKRSQTEGKKIYLRSSSEAKTYTPKNRRPLKNLKEIIERGLIKENEEIYFYYRNQEYSGRVTPGGKIKTYLGEFSPSKAAVTIMVDNPDSQRNKENANGYYEWKTWNGVPIGDLRKI